jgi:hypothetical protein
LLSWKAPTSVGDIQSFLVLARYYRRFIEGFSKIRKLNIRIIANMEAMEMEVGSNLLQEIWKGQVEDEKVQEIKHNIKDEKSSGFLEDEEGVLWYKRRVCVPNIMELQDKILHDAHESAYSVHPGGNKMYHDIKATYWWYGMKKDVAEYVALSNTCQ